MVNKKIFISYSHQDHTCAQGIGRFLLRQGYDVWIDVEKLVTGKEWAEDINEAMKKANVFVVLLSKNSIRRPEVLREISLALERMKSDDKFKVIFIVIGKLHPSWFAGNDERTTKNVVDYLQKVQFVQLDARGTIKISSMQELLKALDGKLIYSDGTINYDDNSDYVFEGGMPEKTYDNDSENSFFKVHFSDLSPSTAFPFGLDNQWLPDEIMHDDSLFRGEFLKDGFGSEKVQKYLENFHKHNLFLALIHTRQLILNRASILNSRSIQRFYCDSGYTYNEKKAFEELLKNGSIIVFLYGNNELTPFVSKLPDYSTMSYAIDAWNDLCTRISMYCIRENWENPVDKHSIDFVKHCTTLAFNKEINEMLVECLGYDDTKKHDFYDVLKEIEMTVFLQTHILGTGNKSKVEGYSRSTFYKNFIVLDKGIDVSRSVLDCIFDSNKPFHEELKKIIDVYYNSIFTNYFNCDAMIPNNIDPKDTYLYQLYLQHGIKEVGPDELKYAFSEFFKNDKILEVISEIGEDFYIDNWSLERIFKYREGMQWREYIELLEYITNRSSSWEIDFSEIEKLVEIFVNSITSSKEGIVEIKKANKFVPSYTFRICIGSKVLDIVCCDNIRKLKSYPGSFFDKSQNNLSIQFLLGDSTSSKNNVADSIFLPIKIFDGRTNYIDGSRYFEEICDFLIEQCEFMWISN